MTSPYNLFLRCIKHKHKRRQCLENIFFANLAFSLWNVLAVCRCACVCAGQCVTCTWTQQGMDIWGLLSAERARGRDFITGQTEEQMN